LLIFVFLFLLIQFDGQGHGREHTGAAPLSYHQPSNTTVTASSIREGFQMAAVRELRTPGGTGHMVSSKPTAGQH
jgi:hypothetical protein